MLARIADEVGRLDVVVNNAFAPYVFDPDDRARFWETPWSAYRAQIDGPLKATHTICQAALPLMRQGAARSSTWSATSWRGRASLSRLHHREIGPDRLQPHVGRRTGAARHPRQLRRAGTGLPDRFEPGHEGRGQGDADRADAAATHIASVEDVTGPVLFLASDWAGFVTGQTLHVDGGLVMT